MRRRGHSNTCYFECHAYVDLRIAAQSAETYLEAHNLIDRMLLGEEHWQRNSQILKGIMRRRDARESKQC